MYELTFHLLTLVNFGALFGDETRVRTIRHVFVAFLWVKLSKAQCTYISLTLSYKNALRITLDLFVVGNLLYEHREESFLFGSVTKYICRAEYMRVISFPL
jgi:hypothetical protein